MNWSLTRAGRTAAVSAGKTRCGERRVGSGALTGWAPDAFGDRDEFLGGLRRTVLRTRHPRDGLLHQSPTQVVRAALQHDLRAFDAEFHPAGLNVRNPAVQHDPRQCVDGAIVAMCWAR